MQDWKMEDLDNERTFKNDWPCNNAHAVKGRAFKKCLWCLCTGTVWPFEIFRIMRRHCDSPW